jgi:hypothetical protein
MERQEFNAFEPYRPAPAGPPDAHGEGETTGRAPQRHLPAHLISGVLLLVMAAGLIAWVVRGLTEFDVPFTDFLRALVDGSYDVQITSEALTPYEWALTAALLAVSIGLLCGRRLARGGALLLGVLLVGVALRQAIGALDEGYREIFSIPDYGGWIVATHAVAGVIGVVVLILLAPAGEPPAKRGFDPYGPAPRPDVRQTTAGALVLALAVLTGAWIVDEQHRLVTHLEDYGWGDYLRGLIDPSTGFRASTVVGGSFYPAAFVLGLLTAGVLLVLGRRVARGLALPLLGVAGYLQLRGIIGIEYTQLGSYFEDTRPTLWVLSTFAGAALALIALILLALPAREPRQGAAPPPEPPAGGAFTNTPPPGSPA